MPTAAQQPGAPNSAADTTAQPDTLPEAAQPGEAGELEAVVVTG
jgi:hypothetical protein